MGQILKNKKEKISTNASADEIFDALILSVGSPLESWVHYVCVVWASKYEPIFNSTTQVTKVVPYRC